MRKDKQLNIWNKPICKDINNIDNLIETKNNPKRSFKSMSPDVDKQLNLK